MSSPNTSDTFVIDLIEFDKIDPWFDEASTYFLQLFLNFCFVQGIFIILETKIIKVLPWMMMQMYAQAFTTKSVREI